METYKGFKVPPHPKDGLKHAVEDFNSEDATCGCIGACCEDVHCQDCIFTLGNASEKSLDAFAEYAAEHGYTITRKGYEYVNMEKNVMPELKPGMVVEFRSGDKCLVVTEKWGYMLISSSSTADRPLAGITARTGLQKDDPNIRRIWAPTNPEDIPRYRALSQLAHEDVLDDDSIKLIWERAKVREMTVDEISKALGYEVKVVGREEE